MWDIFHGNKKGFDIQFIYKKQEEKSFTSISFFIFDFGAATLDFSKPKHSFWGKIRALLRGGGPGEASTGLRRPTGVNLTWRR